MSDTMTASKSVLTGIQLIAAIATMASMCFADDKSNSAVKGNDKTVEGAKEKSPQIAKQAIPSTETKPADDAQGLGAFGMLLPLGQKNLDIKIPSFKEGLPSSLIRAGSMTRIDDEFMEMEKLDIRLFGENREKDVRVQLVTGEYHMPTQLLSSDKRSRISRTDFQLEGDTMIFDTKTQQGKMIGNVEMVIFDSSSFTGSPNTKDSIKETDISAPKKSVDTLKKDASNTKNDEKK